MYRGFHKTYPSRKGWLTRSITVTYFDRWYIILLAWMEVNSKHLCYSFNSNYVIAIGKDVIFLDGLFIFEVCV